MSYLPPIDDLRLSASHPSTRWHPASSSSNSSGGGPSNSSSNSSSNSARLHLLSTRRSHLTPLPRSAALASRTRALEGYPPLYTTHDADQLSDLEESLDVLKDNLVRFGDRHIVQIGRRRTLHEEELSEDDEPLRRPSVSFLPASATQGEGIQGRQDEDLDEEDDIEDEEMVHPTAAVARLGGVGSERGPQPPSHHDDDDDDVAAAAQMQQAERRIREAEAEATRAAAVANAARSTAERHAAFQQEQDAVDLDADVEDLDDDGDDVDYD